MSDAFSIEGAAMKDAVESMDIWNAWDKEIVYQLGDRSDKKEVL